MLVSDISPAEHVGRPRHAAAMVQRTAIIPAGQIERLAALIREVDGSHSMGAAALAEALLERGVCFADPGSAVYAAATVRADGTVEPVPKPFPTLASAEQELAMLLGDDYYRDCLPFLAKSVAPVWRPVDE